MRTTGGRAGVYQRIANEERKAARVWQGIAVCAFVGLIGFAVWAFLATGGNDVKWGLFGGRLFAALTFGALAGYAARLAEQHQEAERYNRRLELELASIAPYLVGLPKDVQDGVKKDLAERLFGQKPPEPVRRLRRSQQPTMATVEKLIEALRVALEAVSKR